MSSINRVAYNRTNCILNLTTIVTLISSFGLFLGFLLLLCTNSQFIAFNEYSSTGKYPAIFFYVTIVLIVLYLTIFCVSIFACWMTIDIINRWNNQITLLFRLFIGFIAIAGVVQVAAGILCVVYTRTMPGPLREYMADNLKSNYTGGFGLGYLERQFDKSVDWVQINYQCCGVIGYEDYRNGFYYNSFNKYTIVSIVPQSCCIYREQGQSNQCQMKSVNIYRKGCYDILMWWMETFGAVISAISICFGFLSIIEALMFGCFYTQIAHYISEVNKKQKNIRGSAFKTFEKYLDTDTLQDTISCDESRT